MAAFSLCYCSGPPLLLPGAPRAFTNFQWFTFSLTLAFVFCQPVHLNAQRHQDMLPGAKVKEFEIRYKLKLWASVSQGAQHKRERIDVKTRLPVFTLWQEMETRNANNRTESRSLLFHSLWSKCCVKKKPLTPSIPARFWHYVSLLFLRGSDVFAKLVQL